MIPSSGDMTFTTHLSYHPSMMSRITSRIFGTAPGQVTEEPAALPMEAEDDSTLFKTVGWISAGLGAVALGLFVGRELRQRYKFNRRTPYDLYAHSGDERDVDFGLGI